MLTFCTSVIVAEAFMHSSDRQTSPTAEAGPFFKFVFFGWFLYWKTMHKNIDQWKFSLFNLSLPSRTKIRVTKPIDSVKIMYKKAIRYIFPGHGHQDEFPQTDLKFAQCYYLVDYSNILFLTYSTRKTINVHRYR